MHLRLRSALTFFTACASTLFVARAAEFSVSLSDAAGKPVPDAVVSLTPLDAPAPASAPAAGVQIVQSDQQYRPYVTPVLIGTRVEFPNKDDIQHHLYSVSKAKPFEKPLYESGASEAVVFDRPGVVTLGCNIHDWMVAYVVVLETPWFAKSGAEGRAAIGALPAGRYRVEIWHPRLAAPLNREVTLGETSPLAESVELRLKPDRRVRRAPGAESRSY